MTGLQAFWLFRDLTEGEVEWLSAQAVRRTVPPGAVLFRQGDATPGLHLVEQGAIRIYTYTNDGRERTIDIVGAGQCCGEMGVVDGAPAAAWGAALTESRLWVVPAEVFAQHLRQNPATSLRVSRLLAAKLRDASSQLEETLYLGARERVLCHLARLAERHGRPGTQGGVEVGVRLTHQEIARLAGTSRETVTRVLAELQDRQLLRVAGRRLHFADVAAMRSLVADGLTIHEASD